MNNVMAWGLQVLLLVAAGALISRVLRGAHARLWFWQGLLAVAILLPAVQPWTTPQPQALIQDAPVTLAEGYVAVDSTPSPWWQRAGWTELLLAAGV